MTNKDTSICVYCGASDGVDDIHIDLAESLGKCLTQYNCRMVYGGGSTGLMGACAHATHKSGGSVYGVITEFLRDQEVLFEEIPHEIVETMRHRKDRLIEESDGFVVLPGGVGTLEETTEVLSWIRLRILDKPIVLLDPTGFWDPLLELIDRMVQKGFCPPFRNDRFAKVSDANAAVSFLIDNIH